MPQMATWLLSASAVVCAQAVDDAASLLQLGGGLEISVDDTAEVSQGGAWLGVQAAPMQWHQGNSGALSRWGDASAGGASADHMIGEAGLWAAASGSSASTDLQNGYRQEMINFGDAQYITYITMGKQIIAGIMDTGSFELVVFGSDCRSCGAAAHYNPSLSTTYVAGTLMSQQNYGSGTTVSQQGHEMVAVGPFQALNQTFWNVQTAKMPVLFNAAFEAILGVGPPETPAADAWHFADLAVSSVSAWYDNATHPSKDLVQSATRDILVAKEMSKSPPMLNTFDVKQFSICLRSPSGSDGVFVWNDKQREKHPERFTTIPVLGNHTWSVPLQDVALSGGGSDSNVILGCANGCSAIIDSGTSLLAVPSFVIQHIKQVIATSDINCSNVAALPSLNFKLGEHDFSLPPEAYVAEVVGAVPGYLQSLLSLTGEQAPDSTGNVTELGPKCQLLIMETQANATSGPVWILGSPFFRKYYTSYEIGTDHTNRMIHIALKDDDCSPTDHPSKAAKPELQKIVAARIHLPQTTQKAAERVVVRL